MTIFIGAPHPMNLPRGSDGVVTLRRTVPGFFNGNIRYLFVLYHNVVYNVK